MTTSLLREVVEVVEKVLLLAPEAAAAQVASARELH